MFAESVIGLRLHDAVGLQNPLLLRLVFKSLSFYITCFYVVIYQSERLQLFLAFRLLLLLLPFELATEERTDV